MQDCPWRCGIALKSNGDLLFSELHRPAVEMVRQGTGTKSCGWLGGDLGVEGPIFGVVPLHPRQKGSQVACPICGRGRLLPLSEICRTPVASVPTATISHLERNLPLPQGEGFVGYTCTDYLKDGKWGLWPEAPVNFTKSVN